MKETTLAGAILLAACANSGGGGGDAGSCDAEATSGLVGEQVSSELGQRAMRLSGADSLRWIPPDSAVTMDYRPDRLNIEYDRENRVTGIRCG
ncbi:MAG: I78 family peptidase inhibitor [Parasphingopyxis sp.]